MPQVTDEDRERARLQTCESLCGIDSGEFCDPDHIPSDCERRMDANAEGRASERGRFANEVRGKVHAMNVNTPDEEGIRDLIGTLLPTWAQQEESEEEEQPA